jgi:hypothetical protein
MRCLRRLLGKDLPIHLPQVLGKVRAVGICVGWRFELIGGEVGHAGGLRDEGDDVHAKPGDALIEPETHQREDLFANLGIGPVEVGLFGGEIVEVVFVGLWVESPRRARKVGRVVVRRSAGAVGSGVAGLPDIEVAIGIVL